MQNKIQGNVLSSHNEMEMLCCALKEWLILKLKNVKFS